MSTVGSAYVVIRAISPALKKDISKAAESAAKAAAPAIDKVGKDIEKGLGDSTKRAAEKAGKAAAPAAKSAGMQIGEAMADALPGGYTKKAGEALRRGLDRAVRAAGPDKQGNNLGNRLTKGFGSAISKFRIPLPVMLGFLGLPAIGGALQIIAAYVGGAIGLIGAIGPAFALAGGVGVASMLSLGGAVGAVMLALKTASPMLNRFKIAAGAVGDEFKTIGLDVQRVLLPNLGFAMATLTKAIPTLRTGMTGLGSVVGNVAINLSKVATSATVLRNLATVFREGGPQITNYGSALGSVLRIVTTIAAVAAPFATQFSAFIAKFAASAAAATDAGQKSGALAGFMERAAQVAQQLGLIMSDLGKGLFRVFSAGSDSGKELLDGISAIALKFADWTASVQGQTQLRQFFTNALPVIHEVNGLIGDILKLIVTPIATGDTGGVVAFVSQLRTEVLPALAEIGTAAAGMGPSLVELTTSLAGLVSSMADSGALGAFTATLTVMIDALARLLSLPVVGDLAGYVLAFAGMAKAVDLVIKPFGGLSAAAGPLGNALFGTAEKMGLFQKAGDAIATKVLPKLLPLLARMGGAIYAALGPIGLIILGVTALVAGLIYAYKHSETFRNIVNALGRAIMNGLGAALTWLQGVWDTVWNALVSGWDAVQGAFSAGVDAVVGFFTNLGTTIQGIWDGITGGIAAAWTAIQGAFTAGVDAVVGVVSRFSGFFDIITQPFQGIVQFFTGIWQIISGIFTGNMDQITTGIANAIGGIVRFFLGMPSRIIQAIIPLLPAIGNFFVNVWTTVTTTVANGVNAVIAFMIALPGRALAAVRSLLGLIRSWATSVWNTARSLFTSGVAAVVAYARALPGRVMGAINSLIGTMRSWATSTWNNVRTAFATGVSNAVAAARALPGRAHSAVISLAGTLRSWASGVWSTVRSAFSTGVSNVVSTARGLPGRVVSAVGNLGDRLRQAGRDLIAGMGRGITDALDGLLSTARETAGKVTDAIRGALKINSPSKVMIPVGASIGEGMQVGMRNAMNPLSAEGQRLAMAAIPDIPKSIDAGAAAAAGAQGVGGGVGSLVVSMNVSIDDLAKMSKLADFLDMIENARVNARKTNGSGTVTA